MRAVKADIPEEALSPGMAETPGLCCCHLHNQEAPRGSFAGQNMMTFGQTPGGLLLSALDSNKQKLPMSEAEGSLLQKD